MTMREYMASLDAGDPAGALALMADDLAFLIGLPSGTVTGTSKADFERYVGGRAAPPDRVHHVVRFAVDGDVELAYGIVTESGAPTGAFMSAARVAADGRIRRYQSFFDPSFSLVDRTEVAP
jgi:ketosteroid isomerase-like protein